VTLVAPRIVNDVSYVCDEDQACESSCVARVLFGEVGGQHMLLCIVNEVSE